MTSKEREEFNKYAIKTMKKVFKFNTNKAIENLNWFNDQFGLRIKN